MCEISLETESLSRKWRGGVQGISTVTRIELIKDMLQRLILFFIIILFLMTVIRAGSRFDLELIRMIGKLAVS